MSNLKTLRQRIGSVKSTQKITSAMKMVAAAKLRRSQDAIVAARPYAETMEHMVASLASSDDDVPLMKGREPYRHHLIICAAADRGLCGGFNAHITRRAVRHARELKAKNIQPLFFCVGIKATNALQREWGDATVERFVLPAKGGSLLELANRIAERAIELFLSTRVDAISMVYARFVSAIRQDVLHQSLVPLAVEDTSTGASYGSGVISYEPTRESVLESLLPKNMRTQLYKALLENAASEQGARMSAMDNATRNASDMIADLTLLYNRTRQAAITKELIEIISGAEAL